MASGRINSPGSIKLAADVVRAFGGSWEALERAAVADANGVLKLRRSTINAARNGRGAGG